MIPKFRNPESLEPSIEEIVREGYRSLAGRTLELLDDFRGDFKSGYEPDNKRLQKYRQFLMEVSTTGNIHEMGSEGAEILGQIVQMIDRAIPSDLKPSTPKLTLGMASVAIREYHNIPDFNALLEQAGISEIHFTSDTGCLLREEGPEDNIQKILLSHFNPNMPAYSVLANVHELHHALQDEFNYIGKILNEVLAVPNYEKLDRVIRQNPVLTQTRDDIIAKSNYLRFLNLPVVKVAAIQAGIDFKPFQDFVAVNLPTLDFFTTYTEGDAYVAQHDIIAQSKDLQPYTATLKAYRLLALTEALLSAFQQPDLRYYEVGIGLVEYLKNHPKEKERIMASKRIHQQVSKMVVR